MCVCARVCACVCVCVHAHACMRMWRKPPPDDVARVQEVYPVDDAASLGVDEISRNRRRSLSPRGSRKTGAVAAEAPAADAPVETETKTTTTAAAAHAAAHAAAAPFTGRFAVFARHGDVDASTQQGLHQDVVATRGFHGHLQRLGTRHAIPAGRVKVVYQYTM